MGTLERLKNYLNNTTIEEFNNELSKLDDNYYKGIMVNQMYEQLEKDIKKK